MEFDWDSYNTEHISRHDVYPDEAEQVFRDPEGSEPLPGERETKNAERLSGKLTGDAFYLSSTPVETLEFE